MMAEPATSDELVFFVNGQRVVERGPFLGTRLLGYLRDNLQLTGSKYGCGEGGCGACTVMVSRYDPYTKDISHQCVYACMTPLCSLHGMAVTTVEGIGDSKNLHPVQERLAKSHGSQCGFCSPGMVMSMYTLLRNNPTPSKAEVEAALEGNLCRCTGYRPIVEGFQTFAKDGCCGNPSQCCRDKSGATDQQCDNRSHDDSDDTGARLFDKEKRILYDPSQEPIFPTELILNQDYHCKSVRFSKYGMIWMRPTSLDELLRLKADYPNARLVSGYLEIGLEINIKKSLDPVLISVTHIPEFNSVKITDEKVSFGASVTMATIQHVIETKLSNYPAYKLRLLSAFNDMLSHFGKQAKNRAGIGGHIMTASPSSDLIPVLTAAGCTVTLVSTNGSRRTTALHDGFFTDFRKTCVKEDELLLTVDFPFTKEEDYCHGYKVNKVLHRRDGKIDMLNAGMFVAFEQDHVTVKTLRLYFGGVGATVVSARKTQQAIIGRTWDESLLTEVLDQLVHELSISGQATEYRRSLILGFFFKFYWSVFKGISFQREVRDIPATYKSVTEQQHEARHPLKSVQSFQEVASGQSDSDAVGRPVTHAAALQQTTGEAIYCDDLPPERGELHMAFVKSSKPHAKILCVDTTAALRVPGVNCFVGPDDIPGANNNVFASEKVFYVGQPIGAVLASNRYIAEQAASLVRVEYEGLEPILTMEEAIEKESFGMERRIHEVGNVDEEFERCDHVMEGELRYATHEHFYMETHSCICKPRENDEMEIIAASQAPHLLQMGVATTLGIPSHKINCKVKRLGGGFGGKINFIISMAGAVAVAANKTKKAVRAVLSRDDDMQMSRRHFSMIARYKAGYSAEGRLKAIDCTMYGNAGNSDGSGIAGGLRTAISVLDQAYKITAWRVRPLTCITNLPPFGPLRGFGSQQGHMITENIIENIAVKCGISQIQVRELNMYTEDHKFDHLNQPLNQVRNIRRCWEECMVKSDYQRRRNQVDRYNRENRWKKKGISIIVTKRRVGLTGRLGQAGALVHVYTDGSVLISHGGVEMGQGLFTRCIQVASRVLGIPTELIYINEMATDKVPNATLTAGSCGSDLYCHAVRIACEKIKRNLDSVIMDNPKGTWTDWIKSAYLKRVCLSETGFYRTPGEGFDWETMTGRHGNYFVYGCACAEVEIDCLTGDFEVLRTDIVMDAGESLSPAIDIGQIEGGFIHGYGMFTMEEELRSSTGELLTIGPGLYRIPRVNDIPQEFNVHLLKGAPNNLGVCSSKNLGEPPVFLGASVFFAIKDALYSARADAGVHGIFKLDCPATTERVRMACVDQFTNAV